MRIRDIGGLIVIDFIDMTPVRNQREVEQRLRDALQMDRARIQTGKISRFGLLEMSRQRLRPSLGESSYQICPRCNGRGNIRNTESLAVSVLRLLAGEAMKEQTGRVVAALPVEVATYLLNEKRAALREVEQKSGVELLIVPDPGKDSPDYTIERVRSDDRGHASHHRTSYGLATTPAPVVPDTAQRRPTRAAEPAVGHLPPPASPAAPEHAPDGEKEKTGLVQRLIATVFGKPRKTEAAAGDRRSDGKAPPRESARRGRRRSTGARRESGSRNESARRSEESRRRSRSSRRVESGESKRAAGSERRARPAQPASGGRSGSESRSESRSGTGSESGAGAGNPTGAEKRGANGRRPAPRRASRTGATHGAATQGDAPSPPATATAVEAVPDSPESAGESGAGRRSRTRRGRRGGRRYRRPAAETPSSCTPSGEAAAGEDGARRSASPAGASRTDSSDTKVETVSG